MSSEEVGADVIVRRALYDRLPASAFSVWQGRDMLAVGRVNVDFQKLCEGIVADLEAAGAAVGR